MKIKRILSTLCAFALAGAAFAYTAVAEEVESSEKEYPDVVEVNLYEFHSGIVNGQNTGTLSREEFDRKTVLKAVPNVKSDKTFLTIDGWNYKRAEANLSVYNYMAIEYYYTSEKPLDSAMNIGIMQKDYLTKSYYKLAENKLMTDMWAFSVFDISAVKELLIPEADHNLYQLHIQPYGNTTILADIPSDSVMYIGRIMFFKNKPELLVATPYMNGYSDGTFRPSGTITRAEACTVIARILESEENISGESDFSDVSSGDWFAKYVGYCQSKGFLGSYSGEFLPNKPITRAEFCELVYLTNLATDGDKSVTFVDVDESHPRYKAISAAAALGIVKGYEDGSFGADRTVTRAEAVTMINRARGTSKSVSEIPEEIAMLFLDVKRDHWAFGEIAEASVNHTNWNGEWFVTVKDPLDELLSKVDANLVYDLDGGKAKVSELDEVEKARIAEIRASESSVKIYGQRYYVSSSEGNDKNDGRSERTPLKTIAKANTVAQPSDAILLKRGDIFREPFTANAETVYSAYGVGDKPKIYGSPENGADPEKWALVYDNKETGAKIWRFSNETMRDVGNIVFNDGEGYAFKDIPSSKKSQFVVRGDNSKQYDYREGLSRNLMFFHGANSIVSGGVISPAASEGPLYLRCDNGNPGEIFDSIEFAANTNLIKVQKNNVTLDNLCLMYAGAHGVGASSIKNLHISNCEIGWIGGSVQVYGYSGAGMATRYGNGVEVYGGCEGYSVKDSYIYQVYDAGVTHQYSNTHYDVIMNDVEYSGNVITDCVYSIEYFLGKGGTDEVQRHGNNIIIENNLLRRAGFGFGSTRPDAGAQSHLRTGSSANRFTNFVIRSNVFDRSVTELFEIQTEDEKYLPVMSGNTYIQGFKNKICDYGAFSVTDKGVDGVESIYAGLTSESKTKTICKDADGKFYLVENIPYYSYSYTVDKQGIGSYPLVEDDMSRFEEKPDKILPHTLIKGGIHMNLITGNFTEGTKGVYKSDEETGVRYLHITPENKERVVVLNLYGMNPGIDLTEGQAFVKILLRTNSSHHIHFNCYNIKDHSGAMVQGGALHLRSTTLTKGDETWEELIVPITGFNESYAQITQVQLLPFSNAGIGSSFYDEDGKMTKDVYVDLCCWAVYPNEASAIAGNLFEASMK